MRAVVPDRGSGATGCRSGCSYPARLVVIDHAESRGESRGEQLEVVLPRLAEHACEEWPVRVLLLVRAAPTALRCRHHPPTPADRE